tara:strand:+ start:27631 stop:28740 length:1110 start_codon:yes stop_codon:yes gene_type:complete
MKIVYLFNSSVPSYNASSLQVVNMCNEISNSIGKLTLITPDTGLNQSLSEHYGIKKNFDQIRIKKFKKFPRGLYYYLYSIYSIIFGIRLRPDIFITRNYFTLFLLLILRKKVIFEVHSSLSIEGRLNNFIVKYFKILDSKNIVNLVFITRSVKNFFYDKYKIKSRKSSILSSASGIRTFIPQNQKKLFLKIGYFGLVNKSRGINFLCRLSKIDTKNKYFIYGCARDSLNSLKKKNTNKNIFFYEYVPYKNIKKLMCKMDLLVLPYEKKVTVSGNVDNIANFTSPMKLFDYLSSSKPIIASSLSVLKEILVDKKNCIFVESLNIFKWKLVINKILLNNTQREIISRNNFFLAKKHTYYNRVIKMFDGLII